MFQKMHARNIKIGDYTLPFVLNCCTVGSTDVKSVLYLIIKIGFENFKLVSNALVDTYAKTRELNCEYVVFEKMLVKDVISRTSLVIYYAQHCFHEDSLKVVDSKKAKIQCHWICIQVLNTKFILCSF